MKEEEDGKEKSNLIDSSIILSYFFDGKYKEIIEGEQNISISAITLFEIKKKLLERNITERLVNEKIDYIKSRVIILDVNEKIAEMAAELSKKYNLPSADSLIYASSLKNNLTLLTKDNDFHGLSKVKILRD